MSVESEEEEFDMSTNKGRLSYAKKHYPIGSKYIPMLSYGVSFEEPRISTYEARMYGKYDIEIGAGIIYHHNTNKWAEIVKEEEKMETNILELIRLFPELPTDYCKKLIQKTLEVKEGNLINLSNFIGGLDTCLSYYEMIHGDDSNSKADYVWRRIYEFKNSRNMETQKLSRQGLKEIHSVACSNWKGKLEGMGIRNPLEDYIELTQEEVDEMFTACTKEQLPIVSKYLKQDDGTLDLKNVQGGFIGLADNDSLIALRTKCEYGNKSFWLNSNYNWEIKRDTDNVLCLIPTKKK
jgi:hypothetical protein